MLRYLSIFALAASAVVATMPAETGGVALTAEPEVDVEVAETNGRHLLEDDSGVLSKIHSVENDMRSLDVEDNGVSARGGNSLHLKVVLLHKLRKVRLLIKILNVLLWKVKKSHKLSWKLKIKLIWKIKKVIRILRKIEWKIKWKLRQLKKVHFHRGGASSASLPALC